MALLSGCATHAPYFKLDASLSKDIRSFDGGEYLSLARLCDVYGLDYKWDGIVKVASVQKKSNRVIVRAYSQTVLVNGEAKKIDRPVILNDGTLFVPVSFARSVMGPILGVLPARGIPEAPEGPKKFAIKTIVIDAGHGGKDPGAIGRRAHLREKEMTLAVARKLRDILSGSGIKVVMTRDSDEFVSLPRRADIANRSRADLFVSIHINSSRSKLMRGFECYYLSTATDDNARAVEAFENSSLKISEDASRERSDTLDKTLWDMTLTENRLESAELASYICDSITRSLTIGNRGIRAARFYVLKHTSMPSVLVEAGYISNRYEEMKLRDDSFLDRIAEAIADGILKYKMEYERTQGFTRV